MAEKFRVTYATMSADNEELQSKYDEAAERMKGELGKEYPFVVNGEERWTDEKYEEVFGYASGRRRAIVGLRYSIR